MSEPKFKPGDSVTYRGKTAVVYKIINEEEKKDVKLQGYRYYIRSGGVTLSVPESSLKKSPIISRAGMA